MRLKLEGIDANYDKECPESNVKETKINKAMSVAEQVS